MANQNQRLNATITIGGAVAASLGKAVGSANAKLATIGDTFRPGGVERAQLRIGAAIEQNNRALDQARGQLLDVGAAYLALRGTIGGPMRAAIDFGGQLEDIGQKAELPAERMAEIGREIRALSRDTGLAISAITPAVDALVGRGASTDVAMEAAKPIAEAAFAYKASADDLAAASWAAVDNLKVPAEEVRKALDIMSLAGKRGSFEIADMAAYFPQLGAAYKGLGQEGVGAVADLSAAIQVVRKGTGDASSAATNLQNVIQKIYAPATVRKFGAQGVDVFAEMEQAAQRGLTPIEAIAELTERTLDGDLSRIGDLFEDAQVQAGVRALVQGMNEYREIRDEALGADGVVQEDWMRRMETAEGLMMRWTATIEDLNTSIGETLVPAFGGLLEAVTPVVGKVMVWIEQNPRLVSGIVMATGALIAFKGALAAIRFVGLLGKGGALEMLSFGMNTVGRAAGHLGGAAREAVALQTALGRMNGQSLTTLQALGTGLRGAVMAVPGVGLLANGLAAIGGAIATISAPVWGAFAAGAMVVGAAGATIWKYWDRISSVFSGVAKRIGEELAPAVDFLRPAVEWLAPVGEGISKAWAGVGEVFANVSKWLGGFFEQEVLTDDQKGQYEKMGYDIADLIIDGAMNIPNKIIGLHVQMIEAGGALMKSLWDGFVIKFDEFITWVGSIPGQIINAIGNIDLSSIISWPSPPAWWTRLTGGDEVGAEEPQKKAVGGLFRPGPMIVGERGPELRFENRAGFIATARQTGNLESVAQNIRDLAYGAARGMAGGGAVGGQKIRQSVNLGGLTINAQPGQSPREIADEVMRQLEARMRRGLYDRVQA